MGRTDKGRTNRKRKGWGLELLVGENRRLKSRKETKNSDHFQGLVSRNIQGKKEKKPKRQDGFFAEVVKNFMVLEYKVLQTIDIVLFRIKMILVDISQKKLVNLLQNSIKLTCTINTT